MRFSYTYTYNLFHILFKKNYWFIVESAGFDFRNSRGLGGNRGTWRPQTKPCGHQDQGKGAVTPQETEPSLPVSIWGFPMEAQQWPAEGSGALAAAVLGVSFL